MSVGNEPNAAMSWVTHLALTPAMLSFISDFHLAAAGESLRCRTMVPRSVSSSKSLVSVTSLSSDRWTAMSVPFW